jgi:hypothetical protein
MLLILLFDEFSYAACEENPLDSLEAELFLVKRLDG